MRGQELRAEELISRDRFATGCPIRVVQSRPLRLEIQTMKALRVERRGLERRGCAIYALGFVAAGCLSCTGTSQSRRLEARGFPDYEHLEPVSEGAAQLGDRRRTVQLEQDEAIWLEPVQIWRSPETEGLSVEDEQRLANRIYSLLYARISRDFPMVGAPSQGTLWIGVALTGALASSAVLDTTSTALPDGRLAGEVKGLATGKPPFVGEASIEVRVRDGLSGEVLMQAVDGRVGRTGISGVTDSWSEVDQAFAYWADRLGFALCMERKRTNCVVLSP